MRPLSLLFAAVWTTSSIAGILPRDPSAENSASQQIERSWHSSAGSRLAERAAVSEIRDIEWRSPSPEELTPDAILGSKRLGKRRGGGGGKGGGGSSGGGKSGGSTSSSSSEFSPSTTPQQRQPTNSSPS